MAPTATILDPFAQVRARVALLEDAASPAGARLAAAVLDELFAADEADDRPAAARTPGDSLDLLRRWLAAVEKLDANARGALRDRIAEARWIVAPASKALRHPKMAAMRDAAIDELRARR